VRRSVWDVELPSDWAWYRDRVWDVAPAWGPAGGWGSALVGEEVAAWGSAVAPGNVGGGGRSSR
jgi:hypothetical protein